MQLFRVLNTDLQSCREVLATDSKSVSLRERRLESYRLRSRLRNCITIFSDGVLGIPEKNRFQNKVFKINTVFQC